MCPLWVYRSQAFWVIIRAVAELTKRTSTRNRCVSGPCPRAFDAQSLFVAADVRRLQNRACLSAFRPELKTALSQFLQGFKHTLRPSAVFIRCFAQELAAPSEFVYCSATALPLLAYYGQAFWFIIPGMNKSLTQLFGCHKCPSATCASAARRSGVSGERRHFRPCARLWTQFPTCGFPLFATTAQYWSTTR